MDKYRSFVGTINVSPSENRAPGNGSLREKFFFPPFETIRLSFHSDLRLFPAITLPENRSLPLSLLASLLRTERTNANKLT